MTAPRWRVAGSSVTGPRHARAAEACQDRHLVRVSSSEALIAVVSDGAGSARLGGEGAALVCEAVTQRLHHWAAASADRCSRATLVAACRAVRDGVAAARATAAERAAAASGTLDDYHATLVGALMLPGKGGVLCHIGDGAAVAIGGGGERWTLSAPENGEYADTTYFFTGEDWRRRLRFSLVGPDHDTVFVMSDGVTDVALTHEGGRPRPFMPFFAPIARFLDGADRVAGEEALAATLDSPAIRERIDEDKTLVWASLGASA